MSEIYDKILKAKKEGRLGNAFTGKKLVEIGIKKGTAWTFLWKHKVGTRQTVNEYFKQNDNGTYSFK